MGYQVEAVLEDAVSVQAAANNHFDALKGYGASTALLAEHKALIARAKAGLAGRDSAGRAVRALVGRRHDAHETAVDAIMAARRSARAAFETEMGDDEEALRACTVGAHLPRTQRELEKQARSIADACRETRWKKALAQFGFKPADLAALEAKVAVAGKASEERGRASASVRTAAAAFMADLRELQQTTSRLRKIANAALHGEPALREFDRPAAAPKRKKKKPAPAPG